jgi:adenylate cyclase
MSGERVERRLAAILAADIAGYSRLMGADEEGTLAALKAIRRELGDPKIAEHRGRIVKTTGDGMLVEFASVVDAGDIFGDGVNVVARLEGLAMPGGVCVSRRVQEDAAGRLDLAFEDLGEQQLKNIARPVQVYRIAPGPRPSRPHAGETPALPDPRAALPLPDKPSIAVLPFQNMSGDPEQEYFADGMVEEITTAISRLP